MEKEKNTDISDILDYWSTIEFLGQDSYEKTTGAQSCKKNVNEFKKKLELEEDTNRKPITDFLELTSEDSLQEKIQQTSQDLKMKCWGNITVYLGKIEREKCIKKITEILGLNDEENKRPEKSDDYIALASFQLTPDLKYIPNTLSVSAIIWAISKISSVSDGSLSKVLSQDEYNRDLCGFEFEMRNPSKDTEFTSEIIFSIFKSLKEKYVNRYIENCGQESSCGLKIQYFTDEETKIKKEDNNYLGLSHDFFSEDLRMVKSKINSVNQHGMIKSLSDYILAVANDNESKNRERYDLVHPKPKVDLEGLFHEILNINNAPLGKWPSGYNPSLMQQVAINFATSENTDGIFGKKGAVFSVNGPPGTGKTTLLKEIIADNIVKKAIFLAEYDEPDKAFVVHRFENAYSKWYPEWYSLGKDEINNYSILVTSCNNAAVENITKELPMETGLKEVYFSNYAKELLGDDARGLVAAPLGKKANIASFYYNVLDPLYCEIHENFNNKKSKKEDACEAYKKARQAFNEQLKKVRKLQTETALYEAQCKLQEIQQEIEDIESEIIDLKKHIVNAKKSVRFFDRLFKTSRYTSAIMKPMELYCEQVTKKSELLIKKNEAEAEIRAAKRKNDSANFINFENEGCVVLNHDFINKVLSNEDEDSTAAQTSDPWITYKFNYEREKLLQSALWVTREFVLSSECCMKNFAILGQYWGYKLGDDKKRISFNDHDKEKMVGSLFQTLFILVPVISSTFASIKNFLKDIKNPGVIGTLIIDEAGQAQPQMAVGALYRSRKAIIVGDPKQVEPVVTDDLNLLKTCYVKGKDTLKCYTEKSLSVQKFADIINPFGTYLKDMDNEDNNEWVGCPLLVHRRCIEPMFKISNQISYGGIMKNQTSKPSEEKEAGFLFRSSKWIDIKGKENGNNKDHYVKAQGQKVCELLDEAFGKSKSPNIYIISPFTSVVRGIKNEMNDTDSSMAKNNNWERWIDNNIGTVHTFQGKEADEVIFVLGCDKEAKGAIQWVNSNIVNVAVTRAKYRIYVIGDSDAWNENIYLHILKEKLLSDGEN